MNQKFYQTLEEKGFLIAAHRGSFGGSIIDNTEFSAKVALALGTDIVEMDSIRSTDGVLYAYHDGGEERSFGIKENIKTLSSKEIDELEYLNCLGHKTGQRVMRLEDLLTKLKGKCLINLDRSWDYLDEVFPLIKKLGMEDQIIIKTNPTDEALNFFKNSDLKLMYMVIANTKEEVLKFMIPEINMVAAEILFKEETDEIISEEFINFLKSKNIKIWLNAITLGTRFNLSANYGDNLSVEKDGEGWKWLADHGADIIQTDWPGLVRDFRNNYKK